MSKSIYVEYMEMSTNNIENPRYADLETFFDRLESANKDLKKGYDWIVKTYKTIDKNKLDAIYELFK